MQDGAKDCGISSLLTIIRFYGGDVPKEYLRVITNTTQKGVNAFSLLEAGRKLGFDTKCVNGNVFDIDKKFLPCIAHVVVEQSYKHFVVVFSIDKKRKTIVVADPARGIIKMNVDDFLSISTNNYLFFTPSKKIPIIKSSNVIKDILLNFIYQNKLIFICVILFSLIFTILNILTSFNFQFVLERALAFDSKFNLFFIFLVMAILSLFKASVEYFRSNLLNYLNNKLDYKLIVNSFSHILSLPYLYYRNRTTGEILSRLNDLKELKEYISHIIVTIFVDLFLVLFALLFLFSINFSLACVILIFVLLYFFIVYVFNNIFLRKVRILKDEDISSNSYMIELINGADTVKSMNVFNSVIDRFSYKYDNYLKANYSLIKTVNLKKFFCDSISYLLLLIIVLIGGILVIDEELSIGSLITFNGLIYYFWEPIKNILNFDLIVKNIKIIVERINEILSYEKEELFDNTKILNNINGNISLDKLSYCYVNSFKLLNDLSFSISKGEKVVICGNSGSGKSTLARIISGFLPVNRGMVYIDEKDINDFNLWNLRNEITYVSQNEFLFNDTICDNIDINKTRDYDKVKDISKLVLANEFIEKKSSGYFTLLEENGCNLSGGERQRIVLARTFFKDSNIYILDESFSQIDVERERSILVNIFNRFKDKTIIVISHRFDNNDLYDKIINLEKVNDYKKLSG